MSCYPAHRPVYCIVYWSDRPARYAGVIPLPVVVGPFKTKTQALNAFAIDHPDGLPEGVKHRIQQMIPWYSPKDELGSLHFEQFIDPRTQIRAPKAKVKDAEQTQGASAAGASD